MAFNVCMSVKSFSDLPRLTWQASTLSPLLKCSAEATKGHAVMRVTQELTYCLEKRNHLLYK